MPEWVDYLDYTVSLYYSHFESEIMLASNSLHSTMATLG